MKCLSFLGLLVTSAGCGDSGATPSSNVQVSDSAGIRVVTSPPGDLVYAELAAEPTLSIGQLSGPDELLFGRIVSARRDANGNVVVADGQALEVRIFNVEGRHIQSLGRDGEGPGEFRRLSGAWPIRYRDESSVDSRQIIAADSELDRITRFSGEGTPMGTATLAGRDDMSIRTVGLAGPNAVLSRASPYNLLGFATFGGASVVEMAEAMFGGEENRRVLFVRHRLDGALVDTLAEGKDPAMGNVARGDGAFSFAIPFSSESASAGSPDGVVVADGVGYEIRVFGEDGSLRMIAGLDDAPPIRTDELLERYVRGSAERDERAVREAIEQYQQVPVPDSLPGYNDVLFTEEGEIWARRYRLPGESMARWDVFAPDGVYLGRVAVPVSFRIEEVGRDMALGVHTDELGVERVQLRALTLK